MEELKLKVIGIEGFFDEDEIDITDRVRIEDGWEIKQMAMTTIPKGAVLGDRFAAMVTILLSKSTLDKPRRMKIPQF
jgi:hypothetical protein